MVRDVNAGCAEKVAMVLYPTEDVCAGRRKYGAAFECGDVWTQWREPSSVWEEGDKYVSEEVAVR